MQPRLASGWKQCLVAFSLLGKWKKLYSQARAIVKIGYDGFVLKYGEILRFSYIQMKISKDYN